MTPFPKLSNLKLRNATPNDAHDILQIYSPFVTSTTTSLEFKIPSEAEMRDRISKTIVDFPWLICETQEGAIAGYAYASKHQEREGYQWVTETGIYTSENHRGLGVGSLLYTKLFEILRKQGYYQCLAKISVDNNDLPSGSIEFHKKLGFEYTGAWPNCGNKFGRWVNIYWYVKGLQELRENPEKPVPYSEIRNEISLS